MVGHGWRAVEPAAAASINVPKADPLNILPATKGPPNVPPAVFKPPPTPHQMLVAESNKKAPPHMSPPTKVSPHVCNSNSGNATPQQTELTTLPPPRANVVCPLLLQLTAKGPPPCPAPRIQLPAAPSRTTASTSEPPLYDADTPHLPASYSTDAYSELNSDSLPNKAGTESARLFSSTTRNCINQSGLPTTSVREPECWHEQTSALWQPC